MNSLYERKFSVDHSLSTANQVISDLALRACDQAYGEELQTYRCQLVDDVNKAIFYGFGKGLGLQSKASAYFEALEHYAVHSFSKEAANQQHNYRHLEEYEHVLPCVQLTDITSKEKINYPIFMLDPRYARQKSKYDKMDYQAHAWRSSDSGIASGTNLIEASIHALNELVERDAHSLFLIQAFLSKSRKIRIIDKHTLPANLHSIVKQIEYQYSDNLLLFDITSDMGIPVMYVSMTKQPLPIQPSGCGASLNSYYALERALLETLQPVHVQNENLINNQHEILEKLAEHPLLQRAATADTTLILDRCKRIDYNTIPNNYMNLTIAEQLQTIIKKITAQNCKIFQIPIMQHESGFTCIKYFIPEFEQFHMVQTGKRILPNQRGLQYIREC